MPFHFSASSSPLPSSSSSFFKSSPPKPRTTHFPSISRPNFINFPRRRLEFHAPPSAVLAGLDVGNLDGVLEAASVLTAIIVVHESGHFLAATLQGIHIPLGGFVGFPDNDPDSEIPPDDVNLLKNRPILDRALVISAGVIANIVFAYAIIFVQVVSVGLPVQEIFPGVLVPEVKPFSAASRDGLLSGDVIVSINGNEALKPGVNSVSELVEVIKRSPKGNVVLKIARGDKDFDINTASKVSGPVAIIAVGAEVARSNVDGLYQFAALLNLNLAVINLLPLPALDGGSLALILIEAARGGRKLPMELEQRIMSSGITVVLLLGLFLIIRDTLNLEFFREIL
ncbi:Membrane metalloprotease ARASP, chloroplastic [Linum perenne]